MGDHILGFVGAGNMAGAIIHGIVGTKTFPPEHIYAFNRSRAKSEALRDSVGIHVADSLSEITEKCDIVFLAVKPQNFPEVLSGLKPLVNEKKVFVSIAAGISSQYITDSLGCRCPVICAMPNTPILIGKGATALCRTKNTPEDSYELVKALFGACGTVAELKEDQMNAVISVSGSSPAYFYLFAQAMQKNAVRQGIDASTALELICQTLEGSAGMLRKKDVTPEELIRMVSSPGGTTLMALDVFYHNGLEQTVDEAMTACTKRAEELGR